MWFEYNFLKINPTQCATKLLRLFTCLMVKVGMVAKKGKTHNRKSKNFKFLSESFWENQFLSFFHRKSARKIFQKILHTLLAQGTKCPLRQKCLKQKLLKMVDLLSIGNICWKIFLADFPGKKLNILFFSQKTLTKFFNFLIFCYGFSPSLQPCRPWPWDMERVLKLL